MAIIHVCVWYTDEEPNAILVCGNLKTELLSSNISLQFVATRASISKYLQNVIIVRKTKIVVKDTLHHTLFVH